MKNFIHHVMLRHIYCCNRNGQKKRNFRRPKERCLYLNL